MNGQSTRWQLSILLPVYNYVCTGLVAALQRQAASLDIDYEIIAADDGSPDASVREANRAIDALPGCTYIIRCENVGRAAIRNFLMERARFGRLLFLDCDMEVPDDRFVERYMLADRADVVDGGICTRGDDALACTNLRYIYEHAAEPRHTAAERRKTPYASFRTTNFMVRREVMRACQFDERFRHYGYEDVFFGKQLEEKGYTILHIANPLVLCDFEPNDVFVAKTEEALRTLHRFRDDLRGYSRLIGVTDRVGRVALCLFLLVYRLLGGMWRRNLMGRRPRLRVFALYRLGYYLSLKTNKNLRQ